MSDPLKTLLDDIDALEDEDDDTFGWHDAMRWSPDPPPAWLIDDYAVEPEPVTSNQQRSVERLSVISLTVTLDNGRAVSWSLVEGWTGDAELITAAQAVAGLYTHLPTMTAVARGLIGVAADGRANAATWLAARL